YTDKQSVKIKKYKIKKKKMYKHLNFFFQAEDGIRDRNVTGVQTCALPILKKKRSYIKKTKIRRSFQLLHRTHHQIKVTKRRSHSLKEKDSIFFFCSSLLL